jgi:hypothetical protein
MQAAWRDVSADAAVSGPGPVHALWKARTPSEQLYGTMCWPWRDLASWYPYT